MQSSKDFERTLTVAGRKEVEQIADSLDTLGVKFDQVLTSPLKRANETAAIVANAFKLQKKMKILDELKPEGSRPELYRKIASMAEDASVLIVGHEPYLSSMIAELIGAGQSGQIDLKKAGLARIRITSKVPELRGELRWLLTPKHMKKIAK